MVFHYSIIFEGQPFISFEEILAREFSRYAPVIAFDQPGESLPTSSSVVSADNTILLLLSEGTEPLVISGNNRANHFYRESIAIAMDLLEERKKA